MNSLENITITIPEDRFSETWQNTALLVSKSIFQGATLNQLKIKDVKCTNQYGVGVMVGGFSVNIGFDQVDPDGNLSYYLTKDKSGLFVLYVNDKPYGTLLDYNHIKSIPNPDFPYNLCIINNFVNIDGIEKYSGLKQLRLICPELTELTPLCTLTDLTFLTMSCSNVSNIRPIASLKSLESIYLSGCNKISDYTPLGELNKIETLFIAPNESSVTELDFIKSLSTLKRLVLRNFKSLETFPDCSMLENLKKISISGFPLLNDYQSLLKLKRLSDLHIDHLSILEEN